MAEEANYAVCNERATADAVRAVFDTERGLPIDCFCACGSTPAPGIPRRILHALEIERLRDARLAHAMPRTPLRPEVASKVVILTAEQVAELRNGAGEIAEEPTEVNRG